jgi:TetR/AcrR family transcriptional regulator
MTTWNNKMLSRAAQHEMKREALLREAAASFNRRGFHATSLEALAANLGVTKAALYYYFPNKQKVLLACFERAMQAAFTSLERAKAEGRNGREKAHLAIKYYLHEMIDELSCCVVLTEEHAVSPADLSEHITERDRYEQALRDLIREGIEDGSIIACDPKLVVFTMLGAVNWVPKWFSHSGEWTSAQLSEALAQILDRAISATPSAALVSSVSAPHGHGRTAGPGNPQAGVG